MFLGSPSCAFWRRVCPTVSLLLAESREDSGGACSPAQKPTASKRGSSWPTPIWAQARESWSILEGQAGEEGIAPTPGGTAPPHPTCRLVPQRQPHDVTAQPVGEAVDPLVVEPVPCCLLQLPAGQRGNEGPFPASHRPLQMPMVLGTSQEEQTQHEAEQRLCPGQMMGQLHHQKTWSEGGFCMAGEAKESEKSGLPEMKHRLESHKGGKGAGWTQRRPKSWAWPSS